jgi:hypothetical protein
MGADELVYMVANCFQIRQVVRLTVAGGASVLPSHRLLLLVLVLSRILAEGADALPVSKWDQSLPSLELRNVHIHARGLEEVWQHVMLSQMGVRAVMFMPDSIWPPQGKEFTQRKDFRFDREQCRVVELFKALEETYPDFTHTQDTNTGILWLHPKTRPYDSILASKVRVLHDAVALRMREDVLDALFRLKLPQLRLFAAYPQQNAEYPVDLPAGTFSIRDILNLCCVANPSRTFSVQTGRAEQYCDVQPLAVTGFDPKVHEVSPGAFAYWRVELNPAAQTPPTLDQLMDALAARDRQVRGNARRYLDLTLSVFLQQEVPAKVTPFEKGIWTDVAFLDVEARMDFSGPIFTGFSARLKKALKEEDWAGHPGLKALAAMEVARTEQDTSFLEQAARQPLSAAEIANVKYDMIQILRLSRFLRNKLLDLNPPWAGFSKAEIEALGQTNIFSLP